MSTLEFASAGDRKQPDARVQKPSREGSGKIAKV